MYMQEYFVVIYSSIKGNNLAYRDTRQFVLPYPEQECIGSVYEG